MKKLRQESELGSRKSLSADNDHQVLPADDDESDELAELFTPARRGNRHSSRPQSQAEPLPVSPASRPEVSQNWFAKFLHLKPASRVVILRAGKAQARKEVVKILREWRKFGIRDVAVEKRPTGDVVRARVDAANCKYITTTQLWINVLTLNRFAHSASSIRCDCIHSLGTRQAS